MGGMTVFLCLAWLIRLMEARQLVLPSIESIIPHLTPSTSPALSSSSSSSSSAAAASSYSHTSSEPDYTVSSSSPSKPSSSSSLPLLYPSSSFRADEHGTYNIEYEVTMVTDSSTSATSTDTVTSPEYDLTSETDDVTMTLLYPIPPLPVRFTTGEISGGQIFSGEVSSADHFRVVHLNGSSMLVGARNVVYNISLETLNENKRITFQPNEIDLQYCSRILRKTDEDCQNYIRIITQTNEGHYLVCGTNAYKPLCRYFNETDEFSYNEVRNETGEAKCPFDWRHNNTAIFSGSRLYTATVSDRTARDALIYSSSIRTVRRDSEWLNEPDFVSSFDYEDKVYFFFREPAVEYINCGKAVFSRVARVCKNDNGGSRVMRMQDTWTSFFKARLNCSIPGEFPFYFDELQATSDLGEGNIRPTLAFSDRTSLIYGIFNTPQNSIPGSAVCAFRLADVVRTFGGDFKNQENPGSLWLPHNPKITPHPAQTCANDSQAIPHAVLNYIKRHPLMDQAVPAFGGRPLLVQASFEGYKMTAIAVDWQFHAADQRYYDILFIGTDNGHVLKAMNKGRGEGVEAVIVEDVEVFDTPVVITSLKLYRSRETGQEKLIIISGNDIKSIPLSRCHMHKSCRACVAVQDPYCAWTQDTCSQTNQGIQSLETGRHNGCSDEDVQEPNLPGTETQTPVKAERSSCGPCVCPTTDALTRSTTPPYAPTEPQRNVDTEKEGDNKELQRGAKELCAEASTGDASIEYSSQTLAVATTVAIFLSLMAGFALGYGFNMWRNHEASPHPTHFKPTNTEKVQNTYDVGPSNQTPRNDTKTPPPLSGEKQLNVVYNPLKNNGKTPNGNVETMVNLSKSRKVYV